MKKSYLKWMVLGIALVFMSSLAYAAEPKAAAKPAAAKAAEQKAEKKDDKAAKAEIVDINTATKEQLTSIAGIGEVYAQKIIDGRPYAKKDQLKSVMSG